MMRLALASRNTLMSFSMATHAGGVAVDPMATGTMSNSVVISGGKLVRAHQAPVIASKEYPNSSWRRNQKETTFSSNS
jgi:hypothetical protein